MLKDFFKKIQSLEEGERRHLLVLLTIVTTVFVFVLWINQIKSIFDQAALNQKKPAGATLPSIKENIKSTAGELGQIIFGLNSHLKSQIFPEELEITPVPNPVRVMPPAVKLPE